MENENLQETKPQSIKPELIKEIISWAKMIVFALVFALVITNFVIVNATVPSGSMKDTINVNDRIVAFRLAYLFSEPERFDIIVFRFPDKETELYVKRVIGLPGDKVEIKKGKVYINDEETPLRDDFAKWKRQDDYGPYYVPEGYYFMLGDNRDDSADSRAWVNKFVAKEKILGKVVFKYYPGFKILVGK